MFVRVMGGTIHPYPGIRRNLGEIYPHNKSENDLFQQINWQIISIEADRIYLDYPVIPPGWEDSPNLNQLSHFGVLIDSRGSVIAQDCPWDIKDLTGADQFKWTDRKDRPDSCVNRPLPAGTEQKPKNKNLIKTLAIVAGFGRCFLCLIPNLEIDE